MLITRTKDFAVPEVIYKRITHQETHCIFKASEANRDLLKGSVSSLHGR